MLCREVLGIKGLGVRHWELGIKGRCQTLRTWGDLWALFCLHNLILQMSKLWSGKLRPCVWSRSSLLTVGKVSASAHSERTYFLCIRMTHSHMSVDTVARPGNVSWDPGSLEILILPAVRQSHGSPLATCSLATASRLNESCFMSFPPFRFGMQWIKIAKSAAQSLLVNS